MKNKSKTDKLKMVSKLAGGVAHDFNNVLSIIDGYARMAAMKAEGGDIDACRTYLERIHQATQRGSALTRKLLLFGEHKISGNEIIDLQRHIENFKNLVLPLIGVEVGLFVHCYDTSHIKCPPDLFTEALKCIIGNACDAMPKGGTIFIETRHCAPVMLPQSIRDKQLAGNAEDYILLTISDTGQGMDSDTLVRVVEPFYTTKERGNSAGLGLSVVHGVARQMDALFTMDSKPGEGTTVSLYIPVYTGSLPLKNISVDEQGKASSFEGYTVLVAEDERDLLDVLSHELTGLGFEVLQAGDGNEALEVQDRFEGEIDLLMTDIVMPELDGVRLSELMGAVRPAIRTVYMSGFPAEGKIADIQFPKNANILAKPLQYDVLPLVMQAALNDKAAELYGEMNRGDAVWET